MNENAPRPSKNYVVAKVESIARIHRQTVGAPNNQGIAKVRGVEQFTLKLQSFGNDAQEKMRTIFEKLFLPSVQAKFYASGLVVYDWGSILDISGVNDDNREEGRAALDVFCRVGVELEDDHGIIEKADVSGFVGTESSASSHAILDFSK